MSALVLVADAGDGTVSALRLDGAGLSPLATSPVGKGVGTFAVDSERDLVYAGVKADGDQPAVIVTLALDRAGGALTERSRRPVDDSMTYLSLTDDRRFVLGASYGGGFGGAWPVADDGTVGEPVARVEHPNLHCVVTERDLAYFVSLGADLVDQRRIAEDGDLQPLGEVPLPEGCGPRHLVLEGADAYLITEYSGEVFHLTRRDDGTLAIGEPVSVVDPSAGLKHSRMGADPREEHLIWTADVHVASPSGSRSPGDALTSRSPSDALTSRSPSDALTSRSPSERSETRRFLLASERTASTLASVPVADDGTLGEPVAIERTVEQPRGFTVDGDLVLVTGERATELDVLRVGGDGALERVQRIGVGNGANWVRVVAAR